MFRIPEDLYLLQTTLLEEWMLLGFLSTINRFFPDVISPSNQLFNYIPNLHPVILGVNVFGTNTRETVRKVQSAIRI